MKKKTKSFLYYTLTIGVCFAIIDKFLASVRSVSEAENKSWSEILCITPGYFVLAALIAYIIIDYSKYSKNG